MLDRRAFLTGMGAMGGLVALSGCTWTPRNAQEQGATESASASPEAEPEEPTTADAPDLDDGLVSNRTVYLGYPNWWASIPMPIATSLESYDFAGKEIRPFCSNGGGGLGQSVAAISKLVPEASVGQGLSLYYSGGADMPQTVADWLRG